jgi:hypothetical protein
VEPACAIVEVFTTEVTVIVLVLAFREAVLVAMEDTVTRAVEPA